MNKYKTQGIILTRINFGEADRILTFLTTDHGKIKAIAKGVRKSKSKLAGGIELFSVSHLSILVGKAEIDTLLSTRLVRHYGNIVKDINHTNAAYEFMKLINKNTEDKPEAAYFDLLNDSLASLNDLELNSGITQLWFKAHLLKLTGHSPDLRSNGQGNSLKKAGKYGFDSDKMRFSSLAGGNFAANDIKYLRLCFAAAKPKILAKVIGSDKLSKKLDKLISSMLAGHIRT